MSDDRTLGPRELAALSGVSTDTLRHYERKRVLPPPVRTRAGYRRYPMEAVDRVVLIRRALVVGFTLDELARVLAERARGGVPCRKVHALVTARLEGIDREIAALLTLKKEIGEMLSVWDAKLAATPPGKQALLLEALNKNLHEGSPRRFPTKVPHGGSHEGSHGGSHGGSTRRFATNVREARTFVGNPRGFTPSTRRRD